MIDILITILIFIILFAVGTVLLVVAFCLCIWASKETESIEDDWIIVDERSKGND